MILQSLIKLCYLQTVFAAETSVQSEADAWNEGRLPRLVDPQS